MKLTEREIQYLCHHYGKDLLGVSDLEPLGIEYFLRNNETGQKGRIDCLKKDKDGRYWLIEIKANNFDDKAVNQLVSYGKSFAQQRGLKEKDLVLVALAQKKKYMNDDRLLFISFTNDDLEKLVKREGIDFNRVFPNDECTVRDTTISILRKLNKADLDQIFFNKKTDYKYSNLQVIAEYNNIDIVLKADDVMIGIECKSGSGLGKDQLARYKTNLNLIAKNNHLFLFAHDLDRYKNDLNETGTVLKTWDAFYKDICQLKQISAEEREVISLYQYAQFKTVVRTIRQQAFDYINHNNEFRKHFNLDYSIIMRAGKNFDEPSDKVPYFYYWFDTDKKKNKDLNGIGFLLGMDAIIANRLVVRIGNIDDYEKLDTYRRDFYDRYKYDAGSTQLNLANDFAIDLSKHPSDQLDSKTIHEFAEFIIKSINNFNYVGR